MSDEPDRGSVIVEAAEAGARTAIEAFRSDITVETKASKNDVVTHVDRAAQAAVVERIAAAFPDEPVVAEEVATDTGSGAGTGPTTSVRFVSNVPADGPAWIVDPIDGTANYIRGMRLWGTSVSVVDGREPVASETILPALGDAYVTDEAGTTRNDTPIAPSGRADPETFAVAALGWGPTAGRAQYAELAGTIIERFGDLRRYGSMQAALAFVASGELDAAITTREPTPWDSIAGAHLIERAGGTVTDRRGARWRYGAGSMVASNGHAHDAVLAAARAALE